MYERIAAKITKFVLAIVKKEMLLEMAVNGKSRPKNKRLSRVLSKYARPATHDVSLAKEIRPHWFGEVGALETVVQKMLVASMSPAHKAQATRALNNYSRKRAAEIGSTPERVAAGVKAAVTKRIKNKGSDTCSTN